MKDINSLFSACQKSLKPKKVKHKFNLGEKVITMDVGYVFPNYASKAKELEAKSWTEGERIDQSGKIGVVTAISDTLIDSQPTILYLITPEDKSPQFLIEEPGLGKNYKEIGAKKAGTEKITFSPGDKVRIIKKEFCGSTFVPRGDICREMGCVFFRKVGTIRKCDNANQSAYVGSFPKSVVGRACGGIPYNHLQKVK